MCVCLSVRNSGDAFNAILMLFSSQILNPGRYEQNPKIGIRVHASTHNVSSCSRKVFHLFLFSFSTKLQKKKINKNLFLEVRGDRILALPAGLYLSAHSDFVDLALEHLGAKQLRKCWTCGPFWPLSFVQTGRGSLSSDRKHHTVGTPFGKNRPDPHCKQFPLLTLVLTRT